MSASVRDEARARIERVADDLAHVRKHLVFIGGSVLPQLVEVDQLFDAPRVTKDVDAVAAAASYTRSHAIETAIREARYQHDVLSKNMRRFIAPSGELFDLSFAGEYSGATRSPVDEMAIATAQDMAGRPEIRHLSPTGLFLMKVAAFGDRGANTPSESRDLADLAVLLVGADVIADVRCERHQLSEVRCWATLPIARQFRLPHRTH